MPTIVRALLDRDPPPTLCALWRDRDIIGPLLGLLMVGVVLRDLAQRVIDDAQATRKVARQTLRLARLATGDHSTADVGSDD